MSRFFGDIRYLFINIFVRNFPIWFVRRTCYRLCGMKIGEGSHILLGTRVFAPENISIGKHSIINEDCILDGRGGLTIGDNVSISMQSAIITASHDKNSEVYAFSSNPIIIEDNVWIGMRSTVLQGAVIHEFAVIASGAVFRGIAEKKTVYGGVPAHKICERNIENKYTILWNPPLR